MSLLYTNENFPKIAGDLLRQLGHDVLTSLDAGLANRGIDDQEVLRFATSNGRVVVTHNRRDFRRLHRLFPNHAGIVVCTEDSEASALAQRIHDKLKAGGDMAGRLISVTRP